MPVELSLRYFERIDESLPAINREWLYMYVHDAFIISLLV